MTEKSHAHEKAAHEKGHSHEKTGKHATTQFHLSDLKQYGLTDHEIDRANALGLDLGKILRLITGLIDLLRKEGILGGDTGGGGGVFGQIGVAVPVAGGVGTHVSKPQQAEVETLKHMGAPEEVAALGGGGIVAIIRFILQLISLGKPGV